MHPDDDDHLAHTLAALAQRVDMAAARAAFESERAAGRRPRWPAVAASVLLVVGLVAVAAALGRGGDPAGRSTAPEPRGTTVVDIAIDEPASTVSSTSSTSSTSAPTTTAPMTVPGVAAITRPIVDESRCAAESAWGPVTIRSSGFDPYSGNGTPTSFQVLGDPVAGDRGPVVVIERFADRPWGDLAAATDARAVGSHVATIRVSQRLVGSVPVELAGGTQAYVRSIGLEATTLEQLVAAITDEGYDEVAGPPGLRLLHEHGATGLVGTVSTLECRVPTGESFRIQSLTGDPVLRYVGLLDRPSPFRWGHAGEAIIVIHGPVAPVTPDADGGPVIGGILNAPTVEHVVDADVERWNELLLQPTHLERMHASGGH